MKEETKANSLKIEISNLDQEQATLFCQFLRTIQYWGNIGHCGEFRLSVDGDGSWRPKIEINLEGFKELEPIEEKGQGADYCAKLFIE